MHSSVIHINTSFLPLYFGGAAFIFHSAGRIFRKNSLLNISYRLFMLTSIVTIFTCAFGGASIRPAESEPGVDAGIIKLHAWTASTVLMLTLVLAYYSFRAYSSNERIKNYDRILFITALVFLAFFAVTTGFAFGIRE
jgi:hypothetical protein